MLSVMFGAQNYSVTKTTRFPWVLSQNQNILLFAFRSNLVYLDIVGIDIDLYLLMVEEKIYQQIS